MRFAKEIANGIALLDEKRPGWEKDVDPRVLDMRLSSMHSGCGCVLAQVYGHVDYGMRALGLRGSCCGYEASQHGFCVSLREDFGDSSYARLTDEWRAAITAKRAAGEVR